MMSKLENQLRLSLIEEHIKKAEDYLARSKLAINPSLALVLQQHAEEHLEDAEQLRDELKAASSATSGEQFTTGE